MKAREISCPKCHAILADVALDYDLTPPSLVTRELIQAKCRGGHRLLISVVRWARARRAYTVKVEVA